MAIPSILDADLPQLNPLDPGMRADPTKLIELGRAGHWAARSPLGLVILRHEDCQWALREPRLHQASRLLTEMQGVTDSGFLARRQRSILNTEGEEHSRLRKLVSRAFTPRSADKFRPLMRSVIGGFLDPLTPLGRADFVAQVSQPYPIPIICALLGAPVADLERFSRWADDILKIFNLNLANDLPVIVAATAELDAYVEQLISARRLDPRDDLLSELIAVEEEGDRLSRAELVMMAEAVLVAGTDTTRNQLAMAVHLFCSHPEQWKLLGEHPDMAERAVDEIMRVVPVVRGTIRVATEDIEHRGHLIPKGMLVSPLLSAANMDESIFPDPATFDITREPTRPHLTFGGGIHYCLGANLAKAELAEALPILARRLPDLALDGEPSWRPPLGIQGPTSLPIRFTPNGG